MTRPLYSVAAPTTFLYKKYYSAILQLLSALQQHASYLIPIVLQSTFKLAIKLVDDLRAYMISFFTTFPGHLATVSLQFHVNKLPCSYSSIYLRSNLTATLFDVALFGVFGYLNTLPVELAPI